MKISSLLKNSKMKMSHGDILHSGKGWLPGLYVASGTFRSMTSGELRAAPVAWSGSGCAGGQSSRCRPPPVSPPCAGAQMPGIPPAVLRLHAPNSFQFWFAFVQNAFKVTRQDTGRRWSLQVLIWCRLWLAAFAARQVMLDVHQRYMHCISKVITTRKSRISAGRSAERQKAKVRQFGRRRRCRCGCHRGGARENMRGHLLNWLQQRHWERYGKCMWNVSSPLSARYSRRLWSAVRPAAACAESRAAPSDLQLRCRLGKEGRMTRRTALEKEFAAPSAGRALAAALQAHNAQ